MQYKEIIGSFAIAASYVIVIAISKYMTSDKSNWGHCSIYTHDKYSGKRTDHKKEHRDCINGRLNVYISLFSSKLFHFEILNFFIVIGSIFIVKKWPNPTGYIVTVAMITISYYFYNFIKKFINNKKRDEFRDRFNEIVGLTKKCDGDFDFALLYKKELLYYTDIGLYNAIPAAGAWVILWLLLL